MATTGLVQVALAVRDGRTKLEDLPERTRKKVQDIAKALGDASAKPTTPRRVPIQRAIVGRTGVRRARSV